MNKAINYVCVLCLITNILRQFNCIPCERFDNTAQSVDVFALYLCVCAGEFLFGSSWRMTDTRCSFATYCRIYIAWIDVSVLLLSAETTIHQANARSPATTAENRPALFHVTNRLLHDQNNVIKGIVISKIRGLQLKVTTE